jgi:hypothetical protein
VTRQLLRTALTIGLAWMALAGTQAAERKSDDGPQWPNVASENLPAPNPHPSFVDPDEVTARILRVKPSDIDADTAASMIPGDAQWPNLPADKLPEPAPKSVAAKSAAAAPAAAVAAKPDTVSKPAAPAPDVTGSAKFWTDQADHSPPSPFVVEGGARYWYSSGKIRFAFRNGSPLFGDPTSTLDWHSLTAHSGEAFARVDHRPSGFFIKGLLGLGTVVDGSIDDADFLAGQYKFSDTRSNVSSGSQSYAMLDLGWAYSPVVGTRLSFFVGYHYWHEKMSASGIVCRQASFIVAGCPFAGAMPVGFDTTVFNYEPTWHAVRIGFEGRVAITDRWSFTAEIAGVPYAAMQNKDSHLLRQSPADLGPAPNVITQSDYAYGLETEVFLNYAITPNIEIGGGVRYWGLVSRYGSVTNGPTFAIKNTVTDFDQQRYGVLAQVKARF